MVQSQTRLIYFPVSIFSIVMGMAGFSAALHQGEQVLGFDLGLSSPLRYVTALLFISLLLLYGLKLLRHPAAVAKELHHPIKLSFFPSLSISLILLSMLFLASTPQLAKILWSIGSAAHILFTLYVMNAWFNHSHFEIQHMNPSWFIPVVGNILVPIAGVELGYLELSWFFFSIGLIFWPVLLAIVLYRIIFHHPLPDKLLPTFFILIAPPAVGFLAYLKLVGEVDAFARILFYSGLFFTLLLSTQIRRFSRLQFFLSWWAYSFPLAAITLATFSMYKMTGQPLFQSMGGILLTLLSVVIALLLTLTLKAVLNKQICVDEG